MTICSSATPEIRLGDITTKIGSGATPRGGKGSYKADGISLIRSMNVHDSIFLYSDLAYIDKTQALALANVTLKRNDVLLNITGASVARCCMVPNNVLPARVNQHVAIVRPDKAKADPFYVQYCLVSPYYKDQLLSIAQGGATREALTKEKIENFHIPLPLLPTQRKIAAILSAYDDLIENNLRRIKILEEMAQNLYREWFVKFRFPGHQHARFVNSPLGRIPEGWEVVPFTEIANVLSGGTPKTTVQEYWGGSIPFFAPKDAPESFYVTNTEKSITELGLRKCNSKLYPKDTVFITARGTVGKVVMPSMDMAMNQSCYALSGKQGISQLYLFLATKEQVDYLKKNTGGATFDTIVIDTFRRMLVAKPGNEVIVRFSQLIQPGMELILNILKKNTTLRRNRDLLLPRLISGEVDVSELDIAVPEEAKA
jgi:type I restriction enzyme, S subunit